MASKPKFVIPENLRGIKATKPGLKGDALIRHLAALAAWQTMTSPGGCHYVGKGKARAAKRTAKRARKS
jgi:hypothetical protein